MSRLVGGKADRGIVTQRFNRTTETARRRALRATATPAERRLWQEVRNAQLGVKFRRQYSVDCYVLDFYAPSCKLAVEADGDAHDTRDAEEYDRQRTRHLEAFGIEVLRFTNADILGKPQVVVKVIKEAVARRQAVPNPPLL